MPDTDAYMCVCVHIFTVHTTTEPAASTYEQVK